jgi:hypothetical protein
MIHYPVTRSTTGIGDQRERRAAADGETSDGTVNLSNPRAISPVRLRDSPGRV